MFSVIVVGRDVAEFVGTCLGSVAASEYSDYEVIFVDDASTDDTVRIVETAAELLPELRIVRHASPLGPARARNSGLDASRGEFITFLDADDWVGRNYLSALRRTLAETAADFVRADHVQVRDYRRSVHRAPEWRRETALDPREGIGRPGQFSLIDYPYNSIGAFHARLRENGLLYFSWPHLHTAEDRPWLWRLHLVAKSMAVSNALDHFYRRGRDASLTGVGDQRQLMYLEAYEAVFRLTSIDREASRVHAKAVDQFLRLGARHLRLEQRLSPDLRLEHRQRLTAMLERHRLLDAKSVSSTWSAATRTVTELMDRAPDS